MLDPLLTKVAGRSRSGAESVSPDPLNDPEQKIARRFPSGADSISPDPNTTPKTKSLSRQKNPQSMATYVPEVARLTCKNRFEQSPQDNRARDD